MTNRCREILQVLGPGLLMAGAAIGVSHLVQATRAGADYGYQLLLIILLVNLFKYPFFEYGHRYTAATGKNLLEAYREMGLFFLWAFILLNIVTAVVSIAGVTMITAGLAANLFGDFWSLAIWSAILIGISMVIVMLGHYRFLDKFMKLMMAVLFVATVIACAAALIKGPQAAPDFIGATPWTMVGLGFVIALMGWMPAPIELSVWQSLWMQAKAKTLGRPITVRDALADFNIGYGLTVILAVMFLMMGALVLYGTGIEFAPGGVAFTAQLIEVYTTTLGQWAWPIITVAAFVTMFSTTLTIVDVYPRSLSEGTRLALPIIKINPRPWHYLWMVVIAVAAVMVISLFQSNWRAMLDLATTIAFLAAPVFAFLNYKAITSKAVPPEYRPGKAMRLLSLAGMIYFILFGLAYVGIKLWA